MRTDDEQQLFQQITGSFDEPAFLRRARKTEAAWSILLERARRQRDEWLKIPGIRIGRLFMLSDQFKDLDGVVAASDLVKLSNLMTELKPEMRRQLSVGSRKTIVHAARELIAAITRFNTRWAKYTDEIDYERVNELRHGYNEYYVLEKECAIMSARTAAKGFQPLPMVGQSDVLAELPLLLAPTLYE